MKKVLLFLMIISMLILSCGKKADSNAEMSKSITVMAPDWAVPSDDMIKEFTDETGIEVAMTVVSWDDIRDKISIAAVGGNAAADVIEVDWSWVGEFFAADWLEPIKISQAEIDSMPSIAPFIKDGKVYALPYANDFRVAYYNSEHYAAAGIVEEAKTWDQVYNHAKMIKEKGVVEYPLSMPLSATEPTTTTLIWLAFSKYGVVFNDDGTLNKDAVLGSLEFINKIVNEDKLIDPANMTSSGMDTYRKITSGDASFIVGPTSFVSRVNDPKESKVIGKIVPIMLPGGDSISEYTFALPEGLGVLKLSKNKEAAMEYVRWFNRAETQVQLNAIQNSIPTRTAVLETIINDGTLKNTGALLEQSMTISSPFPNGVPSYYAQMSGSIFNSINEMVLGKITPEQAFNKMNTTVNSLIEEN